MPATVESRTAGSSGQKYVDFDEYIEYQLSKTRQGIRHTDVLASAVSLAIFLLSYVLVFVVVDQWIVAGGLSYAIRLTSLLVVLAVAGGWTVMTIVRPLMRRVTALYAAREIEQSHPELRSSLLTWVDLHRSGRRVPRHIRAAMEKRAALGMSQADMDRAVDRRALMRAAYVLLAVVVITCLYAVLSPKKISPSIWRALIPMADVEVATRTQIREIEPGHTEVLARSQVPVIAELDGVEPEEVTLFFTTADRRYVDEPIRMQETGEGVRKYQAMLTGATGRGLMQDVTYHVVAGDATSPVYQIRVNQPPSAIVNNVTYHYPAYMGLQEKQDTGGAIDAWEGTEVVVRATTNMPVERAMVLFSDTEDTSVKAEEIPMRLVDDTTLEARWRLSFRIGPDGSALSRDHARFYRVQVWNERDQTDPDPTLYPVRIRPDEHPRIKLIHPQQRLEMPANGIVPIAFDAVDPDFLLRHVTMHFKKNGEEFGGTQRPYQAPPYQARVRRSLRLELEPFRLKTGDEFAFYLEAEDNFEPFGHRVENRTRTPEIVIEIVDPVSQEEAKELLEQQEQEAQDQLREADSATNPEDAGARPEEPMQPGEQQDGMEERPQDGQPSEERQPGETPEEMKGEPSSDPMAGEDGSGGGETGQPGDSTTGQPSSKQPSTDGTSEGTPAEQKPSDMPPQEGSQTDPSETGDTSGQPSTDAPNRGTPQQNMGDPSPGAKQDETGSQQPPSQDGASGGDSREGGPREDKAADDQALKELLEWANKQKENGSPEGGDSPQEQPSSTDPSDMPPNGEQSGATPNDPEGSGRENNMSRDDGMPDSQDPMQGTKPGDSPEGVADQLGGEKPESPAPGSPMEQPGMGEPDAGGKPPANPGGKPPGAEQNRPQPGDTTPMPNGDNMSDPKGRDASAPSKGADDAPMTGQMEDNAQGTNAESQPAGSKPSPDNMGDAKPGTAPGEPMKPGGESPAKPSTQQDPGMPQGDPMPGDAGDMPPKPGDASGGERKPSDGTSEPQATRKGEPGESGMKPGDPAAQKPTQSTESRPDGTPKPQSPADQPPSPDTPQSGEMGDRPGSADGMSGDSSQGQPADGSGKAPGQGKQPGQPGSPSSSQEGSPSGKQSDSGSTPSSSGEMGDKPGSPMGSDSSMGGDKPSKGGEGGKPSSQPGGSDMPPNGQQQGASSDGAPMDRQPGEQPGGDSEPMGGEAPQGQQPSGAPGEGEGAQKGGGEKGSDAGGASGGEGGQPMGDAQPGSGTASGSPSAPGTGGQGGSDQVSPGTGTGDGTGAEGGPAAEEAELEYRKRSANLALNRLKEQLERGETPQELLDDLGYTEEDLSRFMQRLEQRLNDTGADQSDAAAAARRQFDSLLRGIDYESAGEVRRGGDGPRKAASGFGAANRPVPPEYRGEQEAYKRRLSREGSGN